MSINLQTQQNLILDFNQKLYKTVIAKQYDQGSRFVPIQCTDNGKPFLLNSSFDVQVKVLTPDNRALLNTVPVQEDGTLLLELTETMLSYPGKAQAEIIIYDTPNSKRLSAMNFCLLIEPSAYDDKRILSSDEFNALTELFEKADADYTYVITAAQESADAAKVSETNAGISEVNAKTSETNAKTSESNAASSAENAALSAANSADSAAIASTKAENAADSAVSASNHAILAESYLHGSTGTRDGEDEDCVTAYYESVKSMLDNNIANTEKAGLVKASDDVNVGVDGTMSVPKLSQLESLIKGASSASVADTIQAMVTLLNNAALTDYNVGTNILIKAAGVPDFWISELYSEKTVYTYTDDDSLIEQVNLNGGTLQIGYYGISFLETGKVDLAGYATTGYVSEKADEIKTYTDERISALDKNSVGLGNVENVSVNNQTPTFSQAGTLTNIASGETNSTLWGKVSKAIAELISHISNAAAHITSAERTAWNAKQDASTAITTSNIGSQSVNYATNASYAVKATKADELLLTLSDWSSQVDGGWLRAFYYSDSGIIEFYAGIDSESGHEYPAIRVARAHADKNGNDITSTYMPIAGGTFTGVVHFYLPGSEGGEVRFVSDVENNNYVVDVAGEVLRVFRSSVAFRPFEINGNTGHFGSGWTFDGTVASSGGVYHTTGTASVTADGDTDTTVYFGVTYVRPPAFSFAINDYSGNFHDYLVFTKEVTTTYAVVRFYRRTGSQAASMTFQWAAVGRYD